MPETTRAVLVNIIREAAHPLTGAPGDDEPLMNLIGDARFVLLGEATHGTHEFYQARAQITKRLITEKDFTAVAVEADWPDAARVNCYVQGIGEDATAREALAGFERFPVWMWRNRDVLSFVEWLRKYNDGRAGNERKVGFYGLDLYSLYRSREAVIAYLENVDKDAAKRARYRYACFDHFGEDTQAYGYIAGFGLSSSCEEEVIKQLRDLQQHAADYARRDGRAALDELFSAQQNARVVKDAEQYYRMMFHGRVSSWNLRDQHMAQTLQALVAHLDAQTARAKVVVWEHNSHVGDARATSMSEQGEYNLGQLVRQQNPAETVLVGLTTYTGTVTAASDWGGPHEQKRVRPALPESYEALFHETGLPQCLLLLRNGGKARQAFRGPRLERAIGVIYLPQTERISHYFSARLPEQFDAIIYCDQTRAVEPLDRTEHWERGEVPETYPSAL